MSLTCHQFILRLTLVSVVVIASFFSDLSAQEIYLHSIANERQPTGDNGYTLDGIQMIEGSRLKLLSLDNFGPDGLYPKKIELIEKYTESGSLESITQVPANQLFFLGAFDKLEPELNDFTKAEIDSLYEWSIRGGKLIIAFGGYIYTDGIANFDLDIAREKWGYEYERNVPSQVIPTDEGANTSIFNGPFGSVVGVNQAALLQGFFSKVTSNSKVLATDFELNPTLILDCNTLDLITSDVDIYTKLGGVSSGDTIKNAYDKIWANTIVFMDQLQGLPEIVHQNNELVLGYHYNSYKWNKDGIFLSNDSIITNPEVGIYTVEVTTNGGCTITSNIFHIKCTPLPIIDLGRDTLLCRKSQIMLNANTEGSIYEWQDKSRDSLFTVTESGVYWVKVTNQCGTTIDTMSVTFANEIDLGQDTTLCHREPLTLSPGILNASYLWSDGTTNSSLDALSSGIYWVEVSDSCGVFRDSINIKYDSQTFLNIGPSDTILCSSEELVLNASSDNATYEWQDGSTNHIYTVKDPGDYTVRVTNACSSELDRIRVYYYEELDLGEDLEICEGSQIVLDANMDGASYKWQDGSTDSKYLVIKSGNYSVETFTSHCGVQSDNISISYKPSPDLSFDTNRIFCFQNSYEIDATIPNATYLWQDGYTGPLYLATSEGNYSVTVTVDGCSSFYEFFLSRNSCPGILDLPNVFTPNNDGLNDTFKPRERRNINSMNTKIFDRSGNLIYENNNPSIEWNGKNFSGIKVPTGIYYYNISYIDLAHNKSNIKGVITILY